MLTPAALKALPSDAGSGSNEQQEANLADHEKIRSSAQELAFRGALRRNCEVVNHVRHDENDGAQYPHLRAGKQEGCGQRVEDGEAGPVCGAWPGNSTIVPEQPVLEQNAGMVDPADQQASGPDASNNEAVTLHRLIMRRGNPLSKARPLSIL